MIEVSSLSVVFPDGTQGLRDISLSIKKGEFIALVGPSGSGKTTLLRTIAGFVAPTEGHIKLAGREVSETPPEKRNLGMVFQQHAVWPHMNVFDNVAYPLKMRGESSATRKCKVEDVLRTVGLEGFGRRKPDSLSGGQRQRVALARSIVADPTVLLLDEALSALDEPLRDSLRRELVSLTRTNNLTTIHVTHDRAEALAIADRVVVLIDGHIRQVASPSELLNRPRDWDVAEFISDATTVPATLNAEGTLTSSELGNSWRPGEYELIEQDNSADHTDVVLAALPHTVTVTSAEDPNAIPAQVTSVLFEGQQFSITAKTHNGRVFRGNTTKRPTIGDSIGLHLERPLVYFRPAS